LPIYHGGRVGRAAAIGRSVPFLSSGNTAMIANFLVFAVLASISAVQATRVTLARPGSRALKVVFACAGLALLGFAARYQILGDTAYLARDAQAFEKDGVKRPQHNP